MPALKLKAPTKVTKEGGKVTFEKVHPSPNGLNAIIFRHHLNEEFLNYEATEAILQLINSRILSYRGAVKGSYSATYIQIYFPESVKMKQIILCSNIISVLFVT